MNTNKRKKILIAALFAVMMAVPIGLRAQTDGFFSDWGGGGRDGGPTGNLGNQGFGVNNMWLENQGFGVNNMGLDNQGFGSNDMGLTNQTFGEAPLGGGVAILVASAAGYALLRKRKVES